MQTSTIRIKKQIAEHVKCVLYVDEHHGDYESKLKFAISGKVIFIEILHEWGVAVRRNPCYPGEKTGEVLHKGSIIKVYEGINFLYENGFIKFYKLINGSNDGWVHNFNTNHEATVLEHSSDKGLRLGKTSPPVYSKQLTKVVIGLIKKLKSQGKEWKAPTYDALRKYDNVPQRKIEGPTTFNRIPDRNRYGSDLEPVRTTRISQPSPKNQLFHESPEFNKIVTMDERYSPYGDWNEKNAATTMAKFSDPSFRAKVVGGHNVMYYKNIIKTNQIRIEKLQIQHKDADNQLRKIAHIVQKYATLDQQDFAENHEKEIFEEFITNLTSGQENEFFTGWKRLDPRQLENKTLYEYKQLIEDSNEAMKKLKSHLLWKQESISELRKIVNVYARVHDHTNQW